MATNQRLPGISFTTRDGGLQTTQLTPTTDSILIIGSAVDGPTNVVVPLQSMADAERLFGPVTYSGDYANPQSTAADGNWNGNTLLKAANEALIGGASNILFVRVGGTAATGNALANGLFTASALYPGRVYNAATCVVTSGSTGYTFTMTQVASKGGVRVLTYPLTATISDVVNKLNQDNYNFTFVFSVAASAASANVSTLGLGTVTLAGGTNGTAVAGEDYAASKAGLYTLLTQTDGTFDQLLTESFDIGILPCIYADDQVTDDGTAATTTVAQKFAEFLYKCSKEGNPCVGVIGARPILKGDLTSMNAIANGNYLTTTSGLYSVPGRQVTLGYFMANGFFYTDTDTGVLVDVGRHLSIVAGPDLLLTQKGLGSYLENGASVYAGLVSQTPVQNGTTNSILRNINQVIGSFTKNIAELLNQGVGRNQVTGALGGGAYVTFRNSRNAGKPIVVSDNTASMRTSDYQTLSLARVVILAEKLVKAACFPFIGKSFSVEVAMALHNAVDQALNKLNEAGALLGGNGQGYLFTIGQDAVSSNLNSLTITLSLRPALEIKWINVIVGVTN